VDSWTIGDGIGGSETYIGVFNSCECLIECLSKNADGITMTNGRETGSCYCEFGMTGSNGSNVWKTYSFSNLSERH